MNILPITKYLEFFQRLIFTKFFFTKYAYFVLYILIELDALEEKVHTKIGGNTDRRQASYATGSNL